MGLQQFDFKLSDPLGIVSVSGRWTPNDAQRLAAWEMYVELVTRVSVADLGPNEGLLREALASLHSLFGTTRELLRRHGPGVAKAEGDGTVSFGSVAIAVLNEVLRPVLARWHPLLADHEGRRPPATGVLLHERAWEHYAALREEISNVRGFLSAYADLLAEVAGVQPVHGRR